MSQDARTFNDLFVHRLDDPEAKKKMAALGGKMIRDRLREEAYSRPVLGTEPVTKADVRPSVRYDTVTKLVTLEPRSRAMPLTFRGTPEARIIRAPRVEIPFYTISSELFEKPQQELYAYDIPLTKVVENNALKDIQEIEDREFTLHIEAAIQATQQEANGGVATTLNATAIGAGSVVEYSVRKGAVARAATTDNAVVYPLQKADLVYGAKMLSHYRRAKKFLMTDTDFLDIYQWTVEDTGDRVQSETTVDGYKYTSLMGFSFVRTVKTDILRPGNVYVFTDPEWLGCFFILNNVQFYIDKKANMISFQAWEDIAIGIVNIASVAKIELYSGDAVPSTDADGILTSVIPKAVRDLGAPFHRVDQGLAFPQVVSY